MAKDIKIAGLPELSFSDLAKLPCSFCTKAAMSLDQSAAAPGVTSRKTAFEIDQRYITGNHCFSPRSKNTGGLQNFVF